MFFSRLLTKRTLLRLRRKRARMDNNCPINIYFVIFRVVCILIMKLSRILQNSFFKKRYYNFNYVFKLKMLHFEKFQGANYKRILSISDYLWYLSYQNLFIPAHELEKCPCSFFSFFNIFLDFFVFLWLVVCDIWYLSVILGLN